MEKHKMLVLIINSKMEKKASKLIYKISPSMQFIHIGKGTAELAVLDELGVGREPKVIMIAIIPSSLITEVLDKLDEGLNLHLPNSGIAFTLDLTAVSGLAVLKYLTGRKE
ncbi:MAG: hypothetical protein WC189_01670 [Bacilli bacterium]|jgi:hypothetical protein|nr:hypothetical protein [Bacilli bacterium]HOH59022.1 hypothetical protein [Bacilli bacterium]